MVESTCGLEKVIKKANLFVERLAKNNGANNRTKAQIISSNKQWLLRYVL